MLKRDVNFSDVVVLRNEEAYVLLHAQCGNNNIDAFVSLSGDMLSLRNFSGSLLCTYNREYDIMKVKHFHDTGDALQFLSEYPMAAPRLSDKVWDEVRETRYLTRRYLEECFGADVVIEEDEEDLGNNEYWENIDDEDWDDPTGEDIYELYENE